MEDKSPSFCRLCEIALASPQEWRQHAKSDWHVYKLRVRVAEPGTVISPPSELSSKGKAVDTDGDTYSNDETESDEPELLTEPEYDPEQCLFCGTNNGSFDDNLIHMSKSHSFTIPYQDYLKVDLETLIGYLHLVIYGYGECILCAMHRGTVEGIQHHMMAKGHCRFEVASDIAEFYELPEQGFHVDEASLRLPSGKLLSHRTRASRLAASRTSHQSVERRLQSGTGPMATSPQESDLVQRQDNTTAEASSSQLSRLTRGDQQSLAHLPDHEVRSLLATSARHLDQSQREEKHAQLKLDKAGNTTLTGHFRMDTSKRFRGPWG